MTKQKQMKLVNTIVTKSIKELKGRSGFGHLFGVIGKELNAEIVAELTTMVWDELKKAGVFEDGK